MTTEPKSADQVLLTLSGSELARRIRQGKLSSRDAVETHIRQIEATNPTIRAVVKERFDEARREALAADELLARVGPDSVPEFHGVPCTIKETFMLTGMPNSAGLVARKHIVSESDAPAVQRFRNAGAIPLGVTNTSELAMWMESFNKVYGRTNNPYDPTRIVGGSSGGEAAMIAAGGSPFGLGSDVGGSIRGPCFFNGIFGHKSSGGLVPNTGQYPMLDNHTTKMLVAGPMARRAEDLMPLLRILAGPDGQDAACVSMPLGDSRQVTLGGRKVINVVDNGAIRVSKDLQAAQQGVLAALQERGMVAEERRFGALKKQFDIWSATIGEEREVPFGRILGDGKRTYPGLEMLKWSVGASNHTWMSIVTALVDPIPDLLPAMRKKLLSMRDDLRAQMLDAMGDDGVMLYPTYTTTAPKHYLPAWQAQRLHMPFAYQGVINALDFPATQVPLGLDRHGLPLGVQVISKPGNDHVTIAVAEELERAFGGWVPPFQRDANKTSGAS